MITSVRPIRHWKIQVLCTSFVVAILFQLPGETRRTAMPFEPRWEGEVWQTLPKFGPGTLQHPTDVAIYQNPDASLVNGFPANPLDYRLLIADHSNRRVVVYVPDPDAADDNPSDGYGWQQYDAPGAEWNGVTPLGSDPGARPLGEPDSIAIDAAGFVYVTDTTWGRVAVFDIDGRFLRSIPVGELVYGIDTLPGTTWNVTGTIAVLGINEATGITSLNFFSAGGADQGQLLGRYEAPAFDTLPGSLVLSAGLRYDGPNRLVVADYGASRVKVFATNNRGVVATPVAEVLNFGRPVNFASPAEADLQAPYAIDLDNKGRLIVSDTDNQRLAFYQPDYTTGTVQYLFQLNANGGLNGFPRGVVEDAAGRLVIVDTGNHEVEVFQIPALAVVDVTVQGPRANAPQVIRPDGIVNGTFVPGDVVTVQFSVVAPAIEQVANVFPTCSAAAVGNPDIEAQPRPVGNAADWPKLVSWTPTTPPEYQVVGAQSVGAIRSLSATHDAYRFECQFVIQESGAASFALGAESRDALGTVLLAAEVKSMVAPIGCADCETEPPSVNAVVTDPGPQQFYNTMATFSITATDVVGPVDTNDPRRSLEASGVRRLYWKWTMGPLVFYDPNFTACPEYPDTNLQCADVTPDDSGNYPPASTVDLLLDPWDADGRNTIEFWAEDAAGNVTSRRTASIAFDNYAPYPLFSFPTPTGPCWHDATDDVNHCWYNSPVAADVNVFDNMTSSGDVNINGVASPLQFSAEGENASFEVTLSDVAGNSGDYRSSSPYYNGRVVHIDSIKPVTTATATGGDVQGSHATLQLSASDEGSGVSQTLYTLRQSDSVIGPVPYNGGDIAIDGFGAWTVDFWSADIAGNVETPRRLDFYLNAPPAANDDVSTGSQGSLQVIDVLSNDTDANGISTLTVVALSQPVALGSVTTDGTTITFRPIARQHGTTTFTYTLSDGHGQHATATVTVTVVPVYDPNSPPVCATAYGGEIWPPNPTQFFSAPVNGVTDPDGDPLTLTILTVTQDEPVDTTGDGRFSPDVQIQNSGQESTVWVRGERDGKGDGRVYEIHFTATDPFGEMCTSSVFWTVPKNQGQPLQVIDSGSRYDTLVVVPAARSKP